jgi:3-hydroxyacyl-[acyl-carrier-protein] dehydratase
MSREEIEAAIPHRAPMLLLDELVSRSGEQIHCRKTFRADEYFFHGHYPNYPLVPGVILCEAAMQAGAVLLASFLAANDGRVPVATRINDVRFKQMVRPGDTVDINVTLNERLADAFFLSAKVTREGKTVVRFEFACTMAAPPGG